VLAHIRYRHLVTTDPEGAWVAEHEGAIVGCALALRREDVWGLSLLIVRPDLQSSGTGGALLRRAKAAWEKAGLPRIGLHEARHTFASLMIAAGVNAKGLTTYLGHSSIQITFDLYGHLMPGNEDEAASLLDAYLARADTAAPLAQVWPERSPTWRPPARAVRGPPPHPCALGNQLVERSDVGVDEPSALALLSAQRPRASLSADARRRPPGSWPLRPSAQSSGS